MSDRAVMNYLAQLPAKPAGPLRRGASEFYLLILTELANRYAGLHGLRTRFAPLSSAVSDGSPKLIVRANNPGDVVRAVQLAEWAENNIPGLREHP